MIKFDKEKNCYCVRVSARNPKTKQPNNLFRIGFSTKAEAQRAEKEMWKQLLGKFNNFVHPSWNQVANECVDHLVSRKGDSAYLDDLALVIRKYGSKAWGRKPIDEITAYEVELLIEGIEGLSEERKKDILKHLRQVFNFAKYKGYIKEVPDPQMRFKLNQKIFKTLNEKQMEYFLEKAWECDHPWKEIWAAACFTGMRNGELYALKPEDVDFDSDTIHVCRGYVEGKGIVDYTKGGYDRIVDLAEPLKRIFLYLIEQDPEREFLLPRIPKWDSRRQADILREFLCSINLPSIRFHDLRAAWCTVLLNKGVPSEQVRAQGGWKDIKTFQRYIRQSAIQIKGSLKVLNSIGSKLGKK